VIRGCFAEQEIPVDWRRATVMEPCQAINPQGCHTCALQAHHGAVLNTKKRLSSSLRRGGQGAACQQFKGLSLLFIHTPCCSSVYQPFHGPVARPDELGRKPSRLKLPAQDGFHRLSLVFAAHEKHDVVRRIEG
jgi:hypothetical protein